MKKKLMVIAIAAACMMAAAGCSDGGRTSDEVETNVSDDAAGMVHLGSTDDVSALIDTIYAGAAQDLLPATLATTHLEMTDTDTIEYNTGIQDLTGIESISISEPMMSSVAYSAIYVRTNDDANAEDIRKAMMDNIDPAKWICVTAQKELSVLAGNDVFFVMGESDTVDEVYAQFEKAAKEKGMTVSKPVEKYNE